MVRDGGGGAPSLQLAHKAIGPEGEEQDRDEEGQDHQHHGLFEDRVTLQPDRARDAGHEAEHREPRRRSGPERKQPGEQQERHGQEPPLPERDREQGIEARRIPSPLCGSSMASMGIVNPRGSVPLAGLVGPRNDIAATKGMPRTSSPRPSSRR